MRRKKLIIVLSAVVVLIGALTVWLYLGQEDLNNRYVRNNIESLVNAYVKQEGQYPRDMATLVSALEREYPESILGPMRRRGKLTVLHEDEKVYRVRVTMSGPRPMDITRNIDKEQGASEPFQ
ncbi:MAG: hypothetical protein IT363_15755 [Methanoregulaceae archaeon]|nr:hypothetical protein [Methanoregulaceae archaeon]